MTSGYTASVHAALEDALEHVDLDRCDQAAVALARRYAATIDAGEGDIQKVGPLLLDALRDLRMTPKSRASVMKGSNDDDSGKRSKWDELEERRAARINGAAAGDTSTP